MKYCSLGRIVLIDDALDCLISFSDFIYAFQVQFYYEGMVHSGSVMRSSWRILFCVLLCYNISSLYAVLVSILMICYQIFYLYGTRSAHNLLSYFVSFLSLLLSCVCFSNFPIVTMCSCALVLSCEYMHTHTHLIQAPSAAKHLAGFILLSQS